MIYLLIDTCSWIDLLSNENKVLPYIKFWAENKDLKIISHEIIRQEWDEHKERKKSALASSLKTKYKHANEILKQERSDIGINLEPDFTNLEAQLLTIDELLSRHSILLTTNKDIKSYTADRSISPKKAPFHNKTDSMKDGYIIFSTLDYLELNNITSFYFISANKREFGNTSNLERSIHSEIIEDYSSIHVEYYSEIDRAINDLKGVLPDIPISDIGTSLKKEVSQSIIIDKSKPFLDQLYQYVSFRYKEIPFIPLHILTNDYPLKVNDSSYCYYSVFNLTTSNPEIVDYFDSFEICKDGSLKFVNDRFTENVIDFERKTKEILSKFSANLIFSINNIESHRRIDIRYFHTNSCNCSGCNFQKGLFISSIVGLAKNSKILEEKLQLAYAHYLLGNFVSSAELYLVIVEDAKVERLNTIRFIAFFNLSKLRNFIEIHYWGDGNADKLLQKLNSIDLEKEYLTLNTRENKKELEWLKSNLFFSENLQEINSLTTKIRDHYYSQLQGGWSSNNHVFELINIYAQLEEFLRQNKIIYTNFSEFKEFTNSYTEGLFASHSISKERSSLNSFDDWTLKLLAFHGNAEIFIKYFKRYNLKGLVYKPSSKDGDSFLDFVFNFFDNGKEIIKAHQDFCETNHDYFWDTYNTLFNNITVLLSYVELDQKDVNSIAIKFIAFLKTPNPIRFHNIKYVNQFLYRKSKQLKTKTINEFIQFAINSNQFHEQNTIETLANILTNSRKTINLSLNNLEELKKTYLDPCKICEQKHSPIDILSICTVLKDKRKIKYIADTVKIKLKEKFSDDLYYLALMFNVIDIDKSNFQKFADFSLPNNAKSNNKRFIGRPNNRISKLNKLINVAFKYGIDLKENKYDKFRGYDPYYDWLLDMENFNYNLFNPNWIIEYDTIFYIKQFEKHLIIKNKIKDYLILNDSRNLKSAFFKIFK